MKKPLYHIPFSTLIAALLIGAAGVFWLSKFLYEQPKQNLAPFLTVMSQCFTTASKNQQQFIIYVPSQALATVLSERLCNDTTVSKQFGEVVAYWAVEPEQSVTFVGKGLADLILAKDNLMAAFKAQATYNYQPVVSYPAYTAYFIAMQEKPRLEKAYFLDKRIGLLDYPTSRSGHILPKRLFKELDINIDNLNISYANSHEALRERLAKGELDLIASYWQQQDKTRFSENYITAISDNISGNRWYLKMTAHNTDLVCAVQETLLAMVKAQNTPYFNEAQPYWQCAGKDVKPLTNKGESHE